MVAPKIKLAAERLSLRIVLTKQVWYGKRDSQHRAKGERQDAHITL